MSKAITPADFELALQAATRLQTKLAERLRGITSSGFSCGCGALHVGPSKVIGVSIPQTYPQQIALGMLWSAQMEDNCGKKWSMGISSFISNLELYPLFRDAFAGIDVKVDHPYTQLYTDKEKGNRQFAPSGRLVKVSKDKPAYVRPTGDLSKSCWLDAELYLDLNGDGSAAKVLIGCHIDPFAFGHASRGNGYYAENDLSRQLTFYVYVADGQATYYLPVARLVELDQATNEATFELSEGVEAFEPEKK